MYKIKLFLLFLLLLVFTKSISGTMSFPTTYGGSSNPSTNPDDYFDVRCGTFNDGSTIESCASSNWTYGIYNSGAYDKQETYVSLSGSNGGTDGAYAQHGTANIHIGWACDVQWTFEEGNCGDTYCNMFIGGDGDNNFNNDPNDPKWGWIAGVPPNYDVYTYYAKNQWGSNYLWRPHTGASEVNITINFTSASVHQVFHNNSLADYAIKTGSSFTSFPYKISILGNVLGHNTGDSAVSSNVSMKVTRIVCYNGTTGAPQGAAPPPETDEPPPKLVDGNTWCTSCTPLQKLNMYPFTFNGWPFITDDKTGTVNATLNATGTCAVMGNETTSANLNYTDMIAGGGVECATTGTTDQVCTIQDSNAFTVNETREICVGCKSEDNLESLNATFCVNTGIYTFNVSGTSQDTCNLDSLTISPGCSAYNEGGITKIRT